MSKQNFAHRFFAPHSSLLERRLKPSGAPDAHRFAAGFRLAIVPDFDQTRSILKHLSTGRTPARGLFLSDLSTLILQLAEVEAHGC